MGPLLPLPLFHGRRAVVAWGWVCAVNVMLFVLTVGALQVIEWDRACLHHPKCTKIVLKHVEQALIVYPTEHHDWEL